MPKLKFILLFVVFMPPAVRTSINHSARLSNARIAFLPSVRTSFIHSAGLRLRDCSTLMLAYGRNAYDVGKITGCLITFICLKAVMLASGSTRPQNWKPTKEFVRNFQQIMQNKPNFPRFSPKKDDLTKKRTQTNPIQNLSSIGAYLLPCRGANAQMAKKMMQAHYLKRIKKIKVDWLYLKQSRFKPNNQSSIIINHLGKACPRMSRPGNNKIALIIYPFGINYRFIKIFEVKL